MPCFHPHRLRRATLTLALVAASAASAGAASIYQVGNSLTSDSTPAAIRELASVALDQPVESGWQIRGASSLSKIWNSPTDYDSVGGTPSGFTNALPAKEWDHVTLQIFPSGQSTLDTDLRAARNFMELTESNPANADTVFYIYGPWTRYWDMDDWELPVEGEDPKTRPRRAYYERVVDELAAERPGRVRLIPAGEVFHEVIERTNAGTLAVEPIQAIDDLYRDHIHANDVGRFLAATTVAATITRASPVGWAFEPSVPGAGALTEEEARQLQQIVWEVLVGAERSGVSPIGDVNLDSRVDATDYGHWAFRYGAREELTADVNGDGRVDQQDVLMIASEYPPSPADVTGDGVASSEDLHEWAQTFGEVLGGDANGDGAIDAADYTVIRDAIASREAADVTGDGAVDGADQQAAEREYGWSTSMREDVNDDGVVDAADYTLWRDGQAYWETYFAGSGTAVPEASAGALAVVAITALRRRRR